MLELLRPEYFLEIDRISLPVREFDADHPFAGDWSNDLDGERLQGPGEVIRQTGNPADLDPRPGGEFVHGDHRSGTELHRLALDSEVLQLLLQKPGVHGQGLL